MMDISVDLLQWFYKCFDKNTSGGTVKNEVISNKGLAEELHKVINRIIYRQYLGLWTSRYVTGK